MKKQLILLSTLLIAVLLLMACDAEETEEPILEPPATGEEALTPEQPFLLENQLNYDVWNGENNQIGEVENMVIDLSNSRVSYVYIETGSFLESVDEDALVPWNALELAIDADPGILTTDDNVFVLQFDQDLLVDAPSPEVIPGDWDLTGNWDAEQREFWSNAGLEGLEPAEEAVNTLLDGAMLATDLLAADIFYDPDILLRTGTDAASQMAVRNAVVDIETGQVQFVIVDAFFGDESRMVPVPLTHFRWDIDTQAFILDVEPEILKNAPFLAGDLNDPDTYFDGWQDDYRNYWL